MIEFQYVRATDVSDALRQMAGDQTAKLIAGGTNLLDLMKLHIERPTTLVDITRLPLDQVERSSSGGLIIGALVRNSDLVNHPAIQDEYPVLASAILAGASQQLRNMATTGGNLLQRTRCPYFYDVATACNKRQPGEGCSAIGGLNRNHAILGTSASCIATHPSDMCVAMAILDANVRVSSARGNRQIPIADFHRLPGDTPDHETNLEPGELITGVELPPNRFSAHYTYLKIRDRLSYAFALVSVAAALDLENGAIKEARLALGGVAHKPWRDRAVEETMRGEPATDETFARVADLLLQGAKGYGYNDFKIELARRSMVTALSQAARGTPQSQSNKKIL